MSDENEYYVYVYIDPRNYEEFYYGKGTGGRKDVHLDATGDSEKAKRIRAIFKQDEEPIVRVIAKGLTAREALLVETTLIWKQRRSLENIAHGHCSRHFRPADRMHVKLPDFDFFNSIYYVNVSESEHRSWEDCRNFGFLSASRGRNWSEQLDRLNPGDVVVAYLKRWAEGGGYAGVGIVNQRSVRVKQFRFRGKPLPEAEIVAHAPRFFEDPDDPELASYLVGIKWVKTFPRNEAKFKPNAGLYTPQRVVASLANQPKTRKYVEATFGLSLGALATEVPG